MTLAETQAYYDTLDVPQAQRFNLLVSIALKLGKPIEGAYSYAHTIMTKESGMIERRIVAAAIKKYGVVFTGVRHGYVMQSMVDVGFLTDMKRDYVFDKEQGFVDSHNNYLSRAQAWHVALEAGQIEEGHGVLYSEDLW